VAAGLSPKAPALLATTANDSLSGLAARDGFTPSSGSRVLVKNQTLPAQNGIYIASAAAWTRATDMAAWSQVPSAYLWVEEGTINADTGWVCTSDPGGVIGVTAITFVQFGGNGTVTAGTGISVTGNQVSVSNTAVTAAAYGDTTHVATFTVNAQGQLTLAGSSAVAFPVTSVFGRTGAVVAAANDYTFAQLASKPTTLAGYGITDAGPSTSARTNIEVTLSAAQTITVGAFNAIVFNTVARDTLSEFNASTGVWTVANTGLYEVVFFAHFAGAADAATLATSVFVNGTETKRVGEQTVSNPTSAASVGGSCGSACLMQLTAGNTVTAQAYMSATASTIHRVDQQAAFTYFQAYRLL
jgi:hypothetical protein